MNILKYEEFENTIKVSRIHFDIATVFGCPAKIIPRPDSRRY
jgi:hypothetical protein